MDRARVLLLDEAPGALLAGELERLLGHGPAVTLNLRRVADHPGTRAARAGRVDFTAFTAFDAFDESALIAATVRDGRGHHAVKSRAGVPLRAAFLAAATHPSPAHRLRVSAGPGRAPTTSSRPPPPGTGSPSRTPRGPTPTPSRSPPGPSCRP
ncbi:hypothetical protein ACWDRR_21840 [Kitasatospora sp. NPDC003701]